MAGGVARRWRRGSAQQRGRARGTAAARSAGGRPRWRRRAARPARPSALMAHERATTRTSSSTSHGLAEEAVGDGRRADDGLASRRSRRARSARSPGCDALRPRAAARRRPCRACACRSRRRRTARARARSSADGPLGGERHLPARAATGAARRAGSRAPAARRRRRGRASCRHRAPASTCSPIGSRTWNVVPWPSSVSNVSVAAVALDHDRARDREALAGAAPDLLGGEERVEDARRRRRRGCRSRCRRR